MSIVQGIAVEEVGDDGKGVVTANSDYRKAGGVDGF